MKAKGKRGRWERAAVRLTVFACSLQWAGKKRTLAVERISRALRAEYKRGQRDQLRRDAEGVLASMAKRKAVRDGE